jgi:hypothetical protein
MRFHLLLVVFFVLLVSNSLASVIPKKYGSNGGKHSFNSTWNTSKAIIKKGGTDYTITANPTWKEDCVAGVEVTNVNGILHFNYSGEDRRELDWSRYGEGFIILKLIKD